MERAAKSKKVACASGPRTPLTSMLPGFTPPDAARGRLHPLDGAHAVVRQLALLPHRRAAGAVLAAHRHQVSDNGLLLVTQDPGVIS